MPAFIGDAASVPVEIPSLLPCKKRRMRLRSGIDPSLSVRVPRWRPAAPLPAPPSPAYRA